MALYERAFLNLGVNNGPMGLAWLNEKVRYATLKGIMAAKKKEIRQVVPAAAPRSRVEIVALYVPEKSKKTQLISGSPAEAARTLVQKLRDEARVIE